ncbi:MAG: aromatic amino acid lyase, partial [Emcibacteraceae bacterium]|nr:aromatic amino acid lyase [Emcibacteraceae bacterium]
MNFQVNPGQMTLKELRKVYRNETTLTLNDDAWDVVRASRKVVDNITEEGRTVYGINTGFGLLAQTSIPEEQLELLQTNLVLSHSTGVGRPIADDVVRLIYTLKVSSLAQGYSGIRASTIETFLKFINAGLIAEIPRKGSVGASGDLAPLAHMTAAIMGEGFVRLKGERMTAKEGLDKCGLTPLLLSSKEGLAFLNGTQVSTA